ncbi:branched-chain amino acid permease [Seongchinamella sediminis]|uniref:Branched-chain amino acid permease n=1 Tax=Seongchinamella sediminis TaxID=2283635 RepID=A0A3L7DTZ1_9GAMM|nr:AzlC family ABC transporter permease [Seongchinamella sediminis]RLQ21038.1 branched-chain amino acid permease [Seongchinamella sediminis]
MNDTLHTVRRGIGDALPLFIPAIPFTLMLAIVILETGMLPAVGWSSSLVIYGGASQLTLLTLLGEGAALAAAVTAALIVNARHLMYSAAMAPTFQQQPPWFRWVGAYFLIDQVFALCILRIDDDPRSFRIYYLSAGMTFWSLWILCTALALIVGPAVPQDWGLAFAVPVMFLALLVMGIDRWPKAMAALAAGLVTLLAAELPHRSGLLLGAVTGVAVGLLLERRQ